jgi:hypothetical protein
VQGSHAWRGDSAVFDEDNLVSHAGLVPLMELAEQAGLSVLLDEHVRFTSERVKSGAANATLKLTSVVAGMAAGADSIDDLDVVRSGGMKKLFGGVYACATLGILLREFTHGHVRQLGAVLRRFLVALAARTPLLAGITERAYIDIDSLLRPVYGKAKQGASFGHTKLAGKSILRRGLSPLAVTISTDTAAPVLAGVRLRAGRAGSSKGAASMVTEAINTAIEAGAQPQNILVRGDSAYCGGKIIAAVVKAGAAFSFAIARNSAVDAAIASIPDDAFVPVRYPGAVTDPDTGELISDAYVAEVDYTAFADSPYEITHGWSCGGYSTPTPRTRCSRSGAITRSSPTAPNQSRTPTSPTASTRSSRPSGPTLSTDPGRTSPPARSRPMPRGPSWPRSPTTCCAPPAPSPTWLATRSPAVPPCALTWSTSRLASPAHNAGPSSTYPATGPEPMSGWPSGERSSALDHRPRLPHAPRRATPRQPTRRAEPSTLDTGPADQLCIRNTSITS